MAELALGSETFSFCLTFFGLSFFVWMLFSMSALIKYERKQIKRGVKIRQEPLPDDIQKFLTSLSTDIIEEKQLFFTKRALSFIKLGKNEVLIQHRKKRWGTFMPYVGYVNLAVKYPVIEYRTSLPGLLFLIPLILPLFTIPFIALMVFVSYRVERGAILDFVHKQMKQA